MNSKAHKNLKWMSKNAKNGFRGYPVGNIAFYGPTDKVATKVVASIVPEEDAGAGEMQKWYSEADVRHDEAILEEIKEFLATHGARSVAMPERIIGCPHEEGIDYPEGEDCPTCPFWKSRDRWTGERLH